MRKTLTKILEEIYGVSEDDIAEVRQSEPGNELGIAA